MKGPSHRRATRGIKAIASPSFYYFLSILPDRLLLLRQRSLYPTSTQLNSGSELSAEPLGSLILATSDHSSRSARQAALKKKKKKKRSCIWKRPLNPLCASFFSKRKRVRPGKIHQTMHLIQPCSFLKLFTLLQRIADGIWVEKLSSASLNNMQMSLRWQKEHYNPSDSLINMSVTISFDSSLTWGVGGGKRRQTIEEVGIERYTQRLARRFCFLQTGDSCNKSRTSAAAAAPRSHTPRSLAVTAERPWNRTAPRVWQPPRVVSEFFCNCARHAAAAHEVLIHTSAWKEIKSKWGGVFFCFPQRTALALHPIWLLVWLV